VHSIPDDSSSAARTTFAPSIHTATELLLQTNGGELLMRTLDSRIVTFASEIATRFVAVEPVITSDPFKAIKLLVPLHSRTFEPETTTLPAETLQTSIENL
jgi:hypothetical protein